MKTSSAWSSCEIRTPTRSPIRRPPEEAPWPLPSSQLLMLRQTIDAVKSTTQELGTSAATSPSSSKVSGSHAVRPMPKSLTPSPASSSSNASICTSMYGARPAPTTNGASPKTTTCSSSTRRTAAPPWITSKPWPFAWVLKRHWTSTSRWGASREISACSCVERGTTNFEARSQDSSHLCSTGARPATQPGPRTIFNPCHVTWSASSIGKQLATRAR
mmetsp:Transcript_122361/g.305413  ORF Transcript_122361/g.305413 Transcript_122361/m.305413 type:complete len:217 (-) Transcript_122361:706-1356(-)